MTAKDSVAAALLERAATLYVEANAEKARIERKHAEAREAFKRLAEQAGVDAVTIGSGERAGTKVAIVHSTRTSFDSEVLEELFQNGKITKGAYYLVTRRQVVPEAFREAHRSGRVTNAVFEKTSVESPVESIRVTVPKGE